MEHILDDDFWDAYTELPMNVQRRIPQKFQLLRQNPRHPSLRFKKVGDLWAIRYYSPYQLEKATPFRLSLANSAPRSHLDCFLPWILGSAQSIMEIPDV